MKDNIVTIDGPSASGKGTLARKIAKYLGFEILDSGLLYRAYAYLFDYGIDHSQIKETINQHITFKSDENGIIVLKENNNITDELRKESTAKAASKISALPETRENLMLLQRGFYSPKGLVADGRDMGTVVFPNAKLKIFLNASPEIRAKRRQLELQNRGQEVNMLALIKDIKQRDLKDKTRKLSPLIPAEDSIVIDSSEMTSEEVLSFTKKLTKKEFNK
jgi:cytidylate kinase